MSHGARSTRFFDRWALAYDQRDVQALAYRPLHDAILRRVDGPAPARIVDLGCGTGQLTRRLVDRFPDAWVVGVDFSPGMLAKAATRLDAATTARCSLVRADAMRLPLAGASIDLVVCTESFHWYGDQRLALRGLADVVRPGGRLLIASIATFTGLGDTLVRRATAITGRPIRALPPNRLRHLLNAAGFDVVHQRRVRRPGFAGWPVLTDARRRSTRSSAGRTGRG